MNVSRQIVSQFRLPRGALGHLAGWIMATRPSNVERNEWTLRLLDLAPDDRVLEIGFGPGVAIERASHIVRAGEIVGIDHSATMVRQATRRNAAAIRAGRVRLIHGDLNDCALPENGFDKIFSANVVQFWEEPVANFRHLRRLLKAGGRIATTYLPRHRGATVADTRRKSGEIRDALAAAGFRRIRTLEQPCGSLSVACVIADK